MDENRAPNDQSGVLKDRFSSKRTGKIIVPCEISLEYSQVEGNKSRSERQLVLFKPETVSCRDNDEPEGARPLRPGCIYFDLAVLQGNSIVVLQQTKM